MNHTMKKRSALVRAAEEGLRREKCRQESSVILAICTVVIGFYLLATLIAQVLG